MNQEQWIIDNQGKIDKMRERLHRMIKREFKDLDSIDKMILYYYVYGISIDGICHLVDKFNGAVRQGIYKNEEL